MAQIKVYSSDECDVKYVSFDSLLSKDLLTSLAIDGTNLKCDYLDPTDGTSYETSLTLPSGGSTTLPDHLVGSPSASGTGLYFKYYGTDGTAAPKLNLITMAYYSPYAYQGNNSSNYGRTNTSWTYLMSLSGNSSSTSVLGQVFNIRFKASSDYGGVGVNTSTSSFSETGNTNKGISTTNAYC